MREAVFDGNPKKSVVTIDGVGDSELVDKYEAAQESHFLKTLR